MLPQEIINRKRQNQALSPEEIHHFVTGLTDNSWSDAQAAALAMAICLNGMTVNERTGLTMAMAHSGDTLSWDRFDLDGPVLDKHSTGGVGDKVSLIVGAIVAATGGYMPKMSGPGLGHTGGTVDKMAAIPGYNIQPDPSLFRETVKNVGFALIGQTGRLAPADKRLYGIRDVTGTIESVDLIAASILSKKLAVAPDVLVLDVKSGTGAFMANENAATELAQALVHIGNAAGVKTSAVVTDMNDVLGHTVGNAMEVHEAIRFLTGEHQEPRLAAVCVKIAEQLLKKSGLSSDPAKTITEVLASGKAADTFGRMVSALGGPKELISKPETFLVDPQISVHPVKAKHSGYIQVVDTKQLGLALVELGGGRRQPDDRIDYAVGLEMCVNNGQKIAADETILDIHHHSETGLKTAIERVWNAIKIVDETPDVSDCIIGEVA